MAKPSRLLDDRTIRAAKPRETLYKLSDGASLRLLIKPDGGKYWRYEYRFSGKQKTLALGVCPSVSLAEARSKAIDARKMLDDGVDPAEERKRAKAARVEQGQNLNTFEAVAIEWFTRKKITWAPATTRKVDEALRIDLIPALGEKDIGEIKTADVVRTLHKIEERSPHMAHKSQQYCGAIIRYAISIGRREEGKFLDLRGALKPLEESHFPSFTLSDLPAFIKKLNEYGGDLKTRTALNLLLRTFVRPAELTGAPWSEFDLDTGLWVIPAGRMKMKSDHCVPLSRQAVDLLMCLKKESGFTPYAFPSSHAPAEKPMTRDTLSKALRTMGFQGMATPHGFRHFASTQLNEMGYNADWIERQLAHKESNKIRGTYNNAQHLKERIRMMQEWSDFIDGLLDTQTQ